MLQLTAVPDSGSLVTLHGVDSSTKLKYLLILNIIINEKVTFITNYAVSQLWQK